MYKLCMICAFMIEAKTYDKAIARAFSYQHHAYSDLLVFVHRLFKKSLNSLEIKLFNLSTTTFISTLFMYIVLLMFQKQLSV